MFPDNLLTSNFSPDCLYENFEAFLENHHAMVRFRGRDYVLVYMLVRLAHDNLDKAQRVFDWAVKGVCIKMLSDKRFGRPAEALSEKGQYWAQYAVSILGQDPGKSISIVEGIFLLEKLALWADTEVRQEFHGQTLASFRERPESNDETVGRIGWLDQFYQQARGRAAEATKEFVLRRDTAIALGITALAGGWMPHDQEIDDALDQRLPTSKSLDKLTDLSTAPHVRGSMVHPERVIQWVLGSYQPELPF